MVPLTTIQGKSPAAIKSLIGSRDTYVWGGGELALAVITSLKKSGVNCKGILNTSNSLIGRSMFHHKIHHPRDALKDKNQSFVVIATQEYKARAIESCIKAGFETAKDFLTYLLIPRPEAIVEISEDVEFHEPQTDSLTAMESVSCMPLQRYATILEKLCDDYPLLTKVTLAEWGEPLLNPDLPEIIHLTHDQGVSVNLKTYLLCLGDIDGILNADPSEINICVVGSGKNYDDRVGASGWRCLLDNLKLLGRKLASIKPNTITSLKYSALKSDQVEQLSELKAVCKKASIRFVYEDTYLMPYDITLKHLEQTENHSGEIVELPWDFERWSRLALEDTSLPCLPQRIFPIVNCDESVSLCHIYKHPKVIDKFLSKNKQELISIRHGHEHCHQCQKFGLHRLDLNVLRGRHPDEVASSSLEEV